MNHGSASLKRRQKMKYSYLCLLLLLSLSIALMPFASQYKDQIPFLIVISGITFWIGFIGTILVAAWINCCRKQSRIFRKICPEQKQLGLIHFFQNKAAVLVDIAMFVMLIGFIIARLVASRIFIPFIFLAMLVFLFGMHCMLNGVCYKYLSYKEVGGNSRL